MQFQEESGCLPPCTTHKFSISDKEVAIIRNYKRFADEDMIIRIYFGNPSMTVKKEFWAYDRGNLLADTGGLLGMLLGVSLLSGFEFLFDMIKKGIGLITRA